jgi:hypothetical protein
MFIGLTKHQDFSTILFTRINLTRSVFGEHIMNIKNRLRATILVCAATFSASAMLVACGGGSGSVSTVSIDSTISGGAAWHARRVMNTLSVNMHKS